MATLAIGGCGRRPADDGFIPQACRPSMTEITRYFPQSIDRDIDLLFVISTSGAMKASQQHLAEQLPRLIEALRILRLGGPGCSTVTRAACDIPDVRIGVISADLGADSYDVPGCAPGGDGGRLQAAPRVAGCAAPRDPWISYVDGKTNIPGATTDPVTQVKEAFSCIGQLGASGCRFQQPLEAARRALDPKLNINPGFRRPDAFLAVVFITNEDDCSVAKPLLFDPAQQGLTDPLGPLTAFRCTEFGIQCDKNGRQPGVRTGCVPGFDWLYKVEDYVKFFQGLKPAGRVMVFGIAGPTSPFEVGVDGANMALKPSCQSDNGFAVPPIRLASVITSFGERGHFNNGVDDQGRPVEVNICSSDFGAALRPLGETDITGDPTSSCLSRPPVTFGCGLACAQGDLVGTDRGGKSTTCTTSCLNRADCVVVEVTGQGTADEKSVLLPRCPSEAFSDPKASCAATCPCWRLHTSPACKGALHGSPYEFEILRQRPPRSATAIMRCSVSQHSWGTTELAATAQCL